jgi:hypothetical protein
MDEKVTTDCIAPVPDGDTRRSSHSLKGGDDVGYVDPELDRATLLRMDSFIVPLVCGMYLLAFLDRANAIEK